jgi:hypothetical protein
MLDNQSPESALDFRHQQNGASLQWTPKSQRTSILADYTRSTVRSSIPYLIPSTLARDISRYRDDANTASLMMDLQGPKWAAGASKLTLGGAYVQTAGSRPSRFPQPEVRVYLPVHRTVSVFADWRYWGYGQRLYAYEAFRTHQFTVGLRMSR